MRLGVVSWVWQRELIERALEGAQRLGIHDMEVGTAGFFGKRTATGAAVDRLGGP